MTPYISLAEEIEATKPDLKDIWETIKLRNPKLIFQQLLDKPFSAINTFKIELLAIYMTTHNNIYVSHSDTDKFINYLNSAKVDSNNLLSKYNNLNSDFDFRYKEEISNNLILGNLTNPKQYLNQYLRSKLRTSKSTSTAYNKQLNPDVMSLAIFKQWLTTVKPLNSVQAETFLQTCRQFPTDIREEFLVAVMAHCPKPSIALQKYIIDYYSDSDNFPSINRYQIRSAARQTLTFPAIHDTRDSEYKPFVANVNRITPDTNNELESTLGTALVLLQQPEYSQLMYDELIKHAQQAPTDLLATYKSKLQTAHKALTKLIKDF